MPSRSSNSPPQGTWVQQSDGTYKWNGEGARYIRRPDGQYIVFQIDDRRFPMGTTIRQAFVAYIAANYATWQNDGGEQVQFDRAVVVYDP